MSLIFMMLLISHCAVSNIQCIVHSNVVMRGRTYLDFTYFRPFFVLFKMIKIKFVIDIVKYLNWICHTFINQQYILFLQTFMWWSKKCFEKIGRQKWTFEWVGPPLWKFTRLSCRKFRGFTAFGASPAFAFSEARNVRCAYVRLSWCSSPSRSPAKWKEAAATVARVRLVDSEFSSTYSLLLCN